MTGFVPAPLQPAPRSRTVASPPPAPAALGRGDLLRLVAVAAGASLLADGIVLLAVGIGAFTAPVGPAAFVPAGVAGTGALLLAVAFAPKPDRTAALLRRAVPRLYPFAPVPLQVGLLVLLLLGGAAVYHGVFDVLSGAHNGGQTAGIADQSDLDSLLIGGSMVVWALTLYAVFGIYTVIRMGRRVDAVRGRDVYGRPAEAPPPERPGRPLRPSPPAPAHAFPATYAVCLIAMAAISVALQALEVDLSPAPATDWLFAQAFLPLFVGPVASAVVMIDRGLRQLEGQYVDLLARAPPRAPDATRATDPAAGAG